MVTHCALADQLCNSTAVLQQIELINVSDPCCDRIRVSSTGEASRDQPLYLGVYSKQPQRHNDRAVYKKEGESGEDSLYAYYFISETHGVKLWVIGPQEGSEMIDT